VARYSLEELADLTMDAASLSLETLRLAVHAIKESPHLLNPRVLAALVGATERMCHLALFLREQVRKEQTPTEGVPVGARPLPPELAEKLREVSEERR